MIMRKSKLLVIWSIIASSLITASVFASTATTTAHKVRTQKQWTNSWMVQKQAVNLAFKKNITRTVANISNGIQVTETTADSATLAKLNTMFTKEQWKTPKKTNPLITITKTQISNWIQTIITSTDPATITKIQSSWGNLWKIVSDKKVTTVKKVVKTVKKVVKTSKKK